MVNQLSKNIRGSILLEALLSIVILSVSITVIIQAMASSLRAANFSSGYTQAMILLDNKMAEIFKEGTIARYFKDTDRFKVPFDEFSYAVSTENYKEEILPSTASVSGLNEVDVKVSWGSEVKEKQLNLKTLMFDEASSTQ